VSDQKKPRKPEINLLTKEEVKQHRILIYDLEHQLQRKSTSDEMRERIRSQLRNLRSELQIHKQSRQRVVKERPTYKGAEF
jgi:hypothetical protein